MNARECSHGVKPATTCILCYPSRVKNSIKKMVEKSATTIVKKVADLIDNNESPLPLSVIPNYMGINLCSVESIAWTKQDDGQLVSLTIHFTPAS